MGDEQSMGSDVFFLTFFLFKSFAKPHLYTLSFEGLIIVDSSRLTVC